ncbi:hypothetical protein [Cupriavidus necator]|uniref:hypothetical protein n=1 Tax=Cupriavidus necator TaxID=106590 RepID=UPI00339D5E63
MTEQTTQVSAPAPAPIESKTRDHVMGEIVHNLTLAMQAAWIEWQHGGGADHAMQWIENTLWGPGLIPDEDEPHAKEAQAYFDAHTDPTDRLDKLTAENPDDAAIDRFAIELKKKLAKARDKGRGGWQTCPPADLSRMLREHVEKGDPRDVANFCAFLWARGEPISPLALCFELSLVPPNGSATPAAASQTERKRERYTGDPQVEWDEFWNEIVSPNGVLDLEQVKKELAAFSMLLHFVPKVYDHATGGAVTYPQTAPSAVCSAIDNHVQDLTDEARNEGEVAASQNAEPVACQHDLLAEYEGANGARAAICAKCGERVQTASSTSPAEPTLFRWKTSWGGWTYRTERPAGWKDLPCFEAYSLSAPEQAAASPADQAEDARDVVPLGEMVCGDVESTIDGYEVGDYELIYGNVLDEINVNHPGKVFTIYIDRAAMSATPPAAIIGQAGE